MPRKYGHAKILAAADKALGATLPPVLAGPPTWAPPGYVCTPEEVVEFLVPGHRRATPKDKADFCKAWNAEGREREKRPQFVQAPPPSEPAASPKPTPRADQAEPVDYGGYLDPEAQRRESQLRAAYWRDTHPEDEERQRFARG